MNCYVTCKKESYPLSKKLERTRLVLSKTPLRVVKTSQMDSSAAKDKVEYICHLPDEEKSSISSKIQRQFRELEKRVDKYFDDLDDVEDLCKANFDIDRFQLKAKVEKEILRKDAGVQTELFQGLLA